MSLRDAPVGCVPIVWNNVDDPDIAPETAAETVLDEIARLGFAGTQHGRGFAEGDVLRRDLERRNLRFAELYSALPAGPDGLTKEAPDIARRDLARLVAAGGEVLVVALDGGGERDTWSGRVPAGAPQWSAVAYAGLCLDVGHYLVGGGEPARAIRAFGPLITHVHLKDVDPSVLARLRSGDLGGFGEAVRARIFTELGNGALDLHGVLTTLDVIGYSGWLMVEQDSSWLRPSEAAAVGGRVLAYALRELDR